MIDEPKDDSENVLAFTKRFDSNADIKEKLNLVKADKPEHAPYRCGHVNVLVDAHLRQLTCRRCGAVVDAFDWINARAEGEQKIEWELKSLRREVVEHREGLENLKREELNTRNRIKNAEAKLAKISMEIANKSIAAGIPVAAVTRETYTDAENS
ncbi:hypothetical protein [Rahnella aquatilis]|uniref:hypothetical protein n=1 Tax=Rahnella aquatilis TaxID=34038 RepID=UPI00366A20B4